MAVTPRLDLRQSQSLLMTPELRQAINLLQATNLELNELIEKELEANPLLEREEDQSAIADPLPPTIDDYPPADSVSAEDEEYKPDLDYDNQTDDFGSDREGYDTDPQYDWADYARSKTAAPDTDYDYFEQKLADQKSLFRKIEEQINFCFSSAADRAVALNLTEQLDAAGYFRGNLPEIAQQLGLPLAKLQQVLRELKTFEPSGLFAQNLAECLQIQLADLGRLDPLAEKVLQNLDLLGQRNFKELKKCCNINDEDLSSVIADIKALNPKPASAYNFDVAGYVIPDVFVRQTPAGEYLVELNQMSLPRLLINRRYYSEIRQQASSAKEAKRYLKSQLGSASFLVRALHQRATTILRISEEIIKAQRNFFEYGIEQLKPMQLRDIAEAAELHESTVSRAVSGKYMHTPRGLFELKYFFSNAAGSYNGKEDTSTLSIKHKIKQLIEKEQPAKILSDDQIVELLAQESIKIARRTVAKYRESMNIPTSAERKRQKRPPR